MTILSCPVVVDGNGADVEVPVVLHSGHWHAQDRARGHSCFKTENKVHVN